MTEKEALTRVKTGNFNGGYGFDMQLLVGAVGIIGEMLKSGQISEVVRCKDCKINTGTKDKPYCVAMSREPDWFCANGKEKE